MTDAFELIPRPRRELAPGVVHVPNWLTVDRQRRLLRACRDWAAHGPGARRAALPNGARMTVASVGLGWHWIPYRYSCTRDDQDGSPVQPFPEWLRQWGADAVADAYDDLHAGARYRPDVALINFYRGDARLGMHRDQDERTPDPVVSLSVGVACLFRLGGTERRSGPSIDVELESGDLIVFGRENRLVYHGVPRLLPERAVPDLGPDLGRGERLEPGERINVTLRVSGLTDRAERLSGGS